jgi:hypothetical protein
MTANTVRVSIVGGTFSGTLSNFVDRQPLAVANGCFSSWPFS